MSEPLIGIDLGTTNSEVAVVRGGRCEVLEIEDGSRLLPSVVGLDDNDQLLVGQAAKNQLALYPERTIKSIKRRMGSDLVVPLGEHDYRPQEISAMILRRLKAVAEQRLGETVKRAVITVPAYFSDAQRQATREAGEIAGLEVARIINEPTAAALAYEANHTGRHHILVYDLGGGTFDVSVVAIENSVVEVLSSHGNNHLGGDDFDQKIVEHVLGQLQAQYSVDATQTPRAMARITQAVEQAKIALSNNPYVSIEEPYLLEADGRPINLSLELSRADYEDMIRDYVDETLQAVHTALGGANLTVSALDEVLLVGGTTRTPLVARRLEEVLGLQPRSEIDPELCVAIGAATQAAVIGGAPVDTVLVDVTPYTFGTSALGELDGVPYSYCFVPLIRKNTPIPVTKSEVFYTVQDGQTEVDVGVYQGEDPDALSNTQIGQFNVEGLRDTPAGNPVVMTFSLDLDGILQVNAREKSTGLEKSIRIEKAMTRLQESGLNEARERIGHLFEQKEPDAAPELDPAKSQQRHITEATALIEKAQRLMAGATPDDREDLVDNIERVRDAIDLGEGQKLRDAANVLSDLIYYLDQ